MRWTRSMSQVAPLGAVIALTLSGCGAATSPGGQAATGASTATTSAAKATTAPTATVAGPTTTLPTVASNAFPTECANQLSGFGPQSQPLVQVGNLVVSQATTGLSYPSYQIPQGAGTKPLALSGPMANPNTAAAPVNPSLKGVGGFTFMICNASASNTVTVQSVSVRVASFTPFSGSLSAWNPCQDGSYNAQSQTMFGGGCGGGLSTNKQLQASLPSGAGVGATATATQVSTGDTGPNQPNPFPPLPLALTPGQSVTVTMGLTAPTTPGTYTFALGLAVNTAAPVFFSTSAPAEFAPVAHEWSGQNCATSTMQAQIPSATQPTYYICPPAA